MAFLGKCLGLGRICCSRTGLRNILKSTISVCLNNIWDAVQNKNPPRAGREKDKDSSRQSKTLDVIETLCRNRNPTFVDKSLSSSKKKFKDKTCEHFCWENWLFYGTSCFFLVTIDFAQFSTFVTESDSLTNHVGKL